MISPTHSHFLTNIVTAVFWFYVPFFFLIGLTFKTMGFHILIKSEFYLFSNNEICGKSNPGPAEKSQSSGVKWLLVSKACCLQFIPGSV